MGVACGLGQATFAALTSAGPAQGAPMRESRNVRNEVRRASGCLLPKGNAHQGVIRQQSGKP